MYIKNYSEVVGGLPFHADFCRIHILTPPKRGLHFSPRDVISIVAAVRPESVVAKEMVLVSGAVVPSVVVGPASDVTSAVAAVPESISQVLEEAKHGPHRQQIGQQ